MEIKVTRPLKHIPLSHKYYFFLRILLFVSGGGKEEINFSKGERKFITRGAVKKELRHFAQ
jgi:hypothetical protein